MRTLVYQPFSGISGDMNLGALIDAGVDPDQLRAELEKLGIDGWSLEISQELRQGISGTRAKVALAHGHTHTHQHGHDHEPDHDHSHKHGHSHDHEHTHAHVHRTFADIRALIEASALSEAVKNRAIDIFQIVAEAEGAVHNQPIEKVHFHEVGAIDSIVDTVGAAVCLELLRVDRVLASNVELGGGTVKCAHGVMPVPAPATAKIITGMPISQGAVNKECTTPTGAAILASTVAGFNQPTSGRVIATGIGIGGRDNPTLPNILPVTLLETVENTTISTAATGLDALPTESVVELAANIDDMTSEAIGALLRRLLEAGALDAWATPATMKKSRPGHLVHALAADTKAPDIAQAFLVHSSTLGLRQSVATRWVLPRTTTTVQTAFGDIRIKHTSGCDFTRVKPEFDDCDQAATQHGVSIQTVQQAAMQAFKD